MANVYAGYLSSLEKEAEIMFLEQEAEERKIQALMDLHEAALEAKYLEAEAMVLRENGSADDLLLYYREAEESASKDKPGIIRKTIEFIRNQISKFLGWLSKVTGKNNERLEELKGQTPTVSKSHFKIINMILGAWDTIHNKLNEWYNQLSTRKQEVLSLGTVTFATFGLKDLIGGALKKLKEDPTTEQQQGEKVAADTEKSREVTNKLNVLCDKFNKLLDTLKTTASNAHADATQARLNKHQNQNNQAAEANADTSDNKGNNNEGTHESASFDGDSLFADFYYERKGRNGNKGNTGTKTDGKGTPLPTVSEGNKQPVKNNPTPQPSPQPAATGTNTGNGQSSGSTTTGEQQPAGGEAQKPKAGERKVQAVAAADGAETATTDDFNFADKAIVVVETIVRFISSLIQILQGSIVELMKQCFSSLFNKEEKNGDEGTDEEKSDNGTPTEGEETEGNESAALDLFGMDLNDTVTVTEDVMDELAELLCDI